MYDFIDVTEIQESSLPSEALRLNGDYIENQIAGYRTLQVSGREALSPELNTYEVGCSNGSKLNSRRYPARTITVYYQLITDSASAFREAFNKLASVLDVENAELIFADEQDKFFIGTTSSIGEIEPGRNAVKGEIEFTCLDPFKYSVEEYEVAPSVGDSSAFVINYNGTFPAYPMIEADFYVDESGEENNNGRCGYVAFFNDEEKILQFGNPEELPEEAIQVVDKNTNTYLVPTTSVLLNHNYVKTNAWSSLSSKYSKNGGVVYKDAVKTGSLVAKHSYGTTDKDTYYLTGSNFGSGARYHGPTATYTFSEAATDFQFTYSQKMCCGSAKSDKKQRGAFQMILSDASGTIIAGIDIFKNDEGTKGQYRMIVNGKVMKESYLDLSYHNKYFGANRSADKKKKITAITTVKSSSITKTGDKISFNVGGIKQTYTVSAIKSKSVNKVTVMFSGKGTYPSLEYNGLYWMKLVKNYQKTVTETIETIRTEYHDIQNKFNANDILIADCASGAVKLNDLERPDLGALGNDWEDFFLKPGTNQIGSSYSEWMDAAYVPSFKLRYREVFL
ncbi:MAG: phage tail family protein [Anaerostipes sp.]|nr:phage tail family protein [Anaerostipes sp.]MDD3503900.1 phage tail family protein [Eubacteriales bacterium]